MAGTTSAIREGHTGLWHELPVIASGLKRQLDDAKGVVVAHFAIGDCRLHRVMVLAAGADHELANPALQVQAASGILGRESFVAMVVSR